MQFGKFNVCTDLQFGSTGKGAITTALAARYRPQILSTTNLPNAGHSAVNESGEKFIAKALPSAAILRRWLPNYTPNIVIGASAAFTIPQLFSEIEITGCNSLLTIHPRAGVITDEHKAIELGSSGTKHLASTLQGCGAFLAEKVMRKQGIKLARDYQELEQYMPHNFVDRMGYNIDDGSLPIMLTQVMQDHNVTILHEGAQGFSLDINHGHSYPYCTSRGTTAIQNLADMGIGPKMLGDVYGLFRPFPIRVGNLIEDGVMTGHSGGCYDDQRELTWRDVMDHCGGPSDLEKGELTTVTKRVRRVFTLSDTQLREAILTNGVTKLVLTFANYIDWGCYGLTEYEKLPKRVHDFVSRIESDFNIPIAIIETGPQLDHICYNPNCI